MADGRRTPGFKLIPYRRMRELTNGSLERNIYVHPNRVAREMFWQRLETLYALMEPRVSADTRVLDAGGGSGAFLPSLSRLVGQVDVLDLEPSDAERIRASYSLENVRILKEDIATYSDEYDAVVFADVLEHFEDLSVPMACIRRCLKPSGWLFVSLPTENLLYEVGRLIIRKTKPADHYHSARQVLEYLESQGLQIRRRRMAPRYGLALPLFAVAAISWAT